ncbi:MAG: (2Fe-2S)-binding domain protein [Paucimonas sp.]|nr:(2Fe-2S)-binding domain protein [Paucimonas sp.]
MNAPTFTPAMPLQRKLEQGQLMVNGQPVRRDVEDRTSLADFVRDRCGLTGTHLGCEHGVCGACTLLVDGKPVRSCITLAADCEGHSVQTIEGYDGNALMEQLRKAFTIHHALQCGYCTPGMLATAHDIATRLPDADEKRVRLELSGNICRCTGYVGIVRAIMSVLAERKEQALMPGASVSTTLTPATSAPQGRAGAEPAASAAAAGWQSFEAATAAAGAVPSASVAPASVAPASVAPLPGADQPGVNKKAWSRIDDHVDIQAPIDQVWETMRDVRQLAACLPGAEITETNGNTISGRVGIKFGPITAAFKGTAVLVRQEEERAGNLKGGGTDSISHSRASADIGYRLVSIDAGRATRIEITLQHMLQGPLAQFSRSNLVRDFVRRMITDFGRNLDARLTGAAPGAAPPAASANGFALLGSLLGSWLKRLFGGK